MNEKSAETRLSLRIYFANGSMFGPGKADLLMHIAKTGSIAAAGRKLGMSYKRAWSLVDVMNGMFDTPLVKSSRGGANQGGAELTARGEEILALYRELQRGTQSATEDQIAAMEARLAPGGSG